MTSETFTPTIPVNLSHSQASTLGKCGGQYWLEKVVRAPQRPGWAALAGSAAHAATEEWDLNAVKTGDVSTDPDYLQTLFGHAFDNQITEQLAKTEYPIEEWRASGRATKAWPDKENEAFWRSEGWKMVNAWATWRLNSGWEIAQLPTPEGELQWGIEVEFKVEIQGIPVVGFIDRVLARSNDLMAVDLKFGTYEPDSTDQLGTYAYGMHHALGVRPKWGCYWMARKGGTTIPADLDPWTDARVEYRFTAARAQQLAGVFPYHPSRLCGSCSVNRFCPEYGGDLADTVPQPWEVSSPPALRSPGPAVMMGVPTEQEIDTDE